MNVALSQNFLRGFGFQALFFVERDRDLLILCLVRVGIVEED